MADDWTMPEGNLMVGRRGLVMGVANQNSIAWGIAKQLAAQGAEIAFTYQAMRWSAVSAHWSSPSGWIS